MYAPSRSRQPVDFPVRLRAAAAGLLEHGHLFGTVAYSVDLDDEAPELIADAAYKLLVGDYLDVAANHYHIRLPSSVQMRSAAQLATLVMQLKPHAWVSVSVRSPAPQLRGPLWVDSVLVVDSVTTDVTRLPATIGSVSVEGWFGGGMLVALQDRVEAYNGYYLIVDADEYADAKAWLEGDGTPTWQLLQRPSRRS